MTAFSNTSVLLAAFLVLSIMIAEGAVTKKPKNTASSKGTCFRENFEKVSKCCKTSPGTLFDKGAATGCKKLNTNTNMAIGTEYNMNKLMYDNKTIVLGGAGDNLKVNKNAFCWAECLFNNLTLITDGEVDSALLTAYMETKVSGADWKTTLTDGITACGTAITTIYDADDTLKTIATDKTGFKTCITQPGLMLQCLLGYIYKSCPQASQISSNDCVLTKEKYTKCELFVVTE